MYKPYWQQPYPKGVVFKWQLMAFVAGCINAGGFMACRRFVTHVTGFATWFGLSAATGDWGEALGMLSVPAFFLLGVMVAAYFTDAATYAGRSPRFGLVNGLAALFLLVAAVSGQGGQFGLFGASFDLSQDYALLALLCAASGVQNAVITTASGAAMRSTHLTGTTTDLGIGLVRSFFGHAQPALKRRERYRNRLRLGSIFSFAAGSVVGAVLFTQFGYLGFLLPCVLVLYVGNLGVRAAKVDASPPKRDESEHASMRKQG